MNEDILRLGAVAPFGVTVRAFRGQLPPPPEKIDQNGVPGWEVQHDLWEYPVT